MLIQPGFHAQNVAYGRPAAASGADEPRDIVGFGQPAGEMPSLDELLATLKRRQTQAMSPYAKLRQEVEPHARQLAEVLKDAAPVRPPTRIDVRRILQPEQFEMFTRREPATPPRRHFALVVEESADRAQALQAAALLGVACEHADQPLAVIGPNGTVHRELRGEGALSSTLESLDHADWTGAAPTTVLGEAVSQLGDAEQKVLIWIGAAPQPEGQRELIRRGIKLIHLPTANPQQLGDAVYRGLKDR